MNRRVRYRRLDAYYRSKVLNSLMMVVMMGLLLCRYCGDTYVVPCIIAGLALALFVAYSLWFWIKKPQRMVVNDMISDVASLMTIYVLIVNAMRVENVLWYVVPMVCGVVTMFVCMVKNSDETVSL